MPRQRAADPAMARSPVVVGPLRAMSARSPTTAPAPEAHPMAVANLSIPHDRLVAFCRRHGIRRLALFGSVLRDDFGPGSDVDLLVDFEPGDRPFRALLDAKAELSDLLGGREVDLIQRSTLNRWVRARVVADAEPLIDLDDDGFGPRPVAAPRTRRRPTMNERDALYFGHILDAAREAVAIAATTNRLAFDSDRTLRLALTHLVQIVGEAARKVSSEGRAAHPDIAWPQMIGMRHILVHNYEGVDEPKVWETVVEDLPALTSTIEAFLPEPPA